MNQTIHVDGMTCGSCVRHVHEALMKIPGVRQADVHLDTESATIDADRKIAHQALAAVLDRAGYALR